MQENYIIKLLLEKTLIILLAFIVVSVNGQPAKIDSLEQVLNIHEADDTIKVNLLNQIALEIYEKNDQKARDYATKAGEISDNIGFIRGKVESLRLIGVSYASKDKAKALTKMQEALKLAEANLDHQGELSCLYVIGATNMTMGNDSIACVYFQKTIGLADTLNDRLLLGKSNLKIAGIYRNQGQSELATESYSKAISIFNQINDKKFEAIALKDLGVLYALNNNYPKSVECLKKSLLNFELLKDTSGIMMGLNNLGGVLNLNDKSDEAFKYFQQALKIAEAKNNKPSITAYLNNIGLYYFKTNNPLALEYFQKVLANGEELHEPIFMINALEKIGNINENKGDLDEALIKYQKAFKLIEENGMKTNSSITMYFISRVYLKQHKYTEALNLSKEALKLAEQFSFVDLQKNLNELLADIYSDKGDYKKAYEHYKQFKTLNDSIYNQSNFKKITELEYTYKFEKEKQALELEQQKKDAIQLAEIRQQRIIMISLVVAFALMSLLAVYIYSSYRNKKKTNLLLIQQKSEIQFKNKELIQLNEEISAQKDEIEAQRDEIEAQRDLVIEQKEEIETQRDLVTAQKERIEEIYKELNNSINYSKRIQNAVLPNVELLTNHFSEVFILFKPKDVVSGDFYWFAKVENQLVVAVADCTGHGVPGALMSMLSMSLLKEIVINEYITQPNIILNRLRKQIIKSMSQSGALGEQKDGMDISLCSINTESLMMQWSGANNPCIIVNEGNLIELKADKMPISYYINMDKFTLHEKQLFKDDIVYLASDGYQDQFGGHENRKFMSKHFKEVLLKNSIYSMQEQEVQLNTIIEDWKSGYDKIHEQTDDITVLGLKI